MYFLWILISFLYFVHFLEIFDWHTRQDDIKTPFLTYIHNYLKCTCSISIFPYATMLRLPVSARRAWRYLGVLRPFYSYHVRGNFTRRRPRSWICSPFRILLAYSSLVQRQMIDYKKKMMNMKKVIIYINNK